MMGWGGGGGVEKWATEVSSLRWHALDAQVERHGA